MLDALLKTYLLPKGWSEPEIYRDKVVISGVEILLFGLSASKANKCVCGSAAGFDEVSCVERAFFELIERVSTVEAENSGRITFPDDGDGKLRYSRSNGIAVHSDFKEARDRAYLEVVERDRVLRSWFGDLDYPIKLECRELNLSGHCAAGLLKEFEMYEVSFVDDHRVDDVYVKCCYGRPKKSNSASFFGFGAARSPKQAGLKAIDEAVQRLGFTWGEPVAAVSDTFEPGPIGHLDYYLDPKRMTVLDEWLKFGVRQGCFVKTEAMIESRPVWRDITPGEYVGALSVIKCEIGGAMPLVFGPRYPLLRPDAPKECWVHPIA